MICIAQDKEKSQTKFDIINLSHHVSKTRPQMPMLDRAAQFSPFAALTGYDDAIHETGRLTDEKIDLSEEEKEALDRKQQILMERLGDHPCSDRYLLRSSRKEVWRGVCDKERKPQKDRRVRALDDAHRRDKNPSG